MKTLPIRWSPDLSPFERRLLYRYLVVVATAIGTACAAMFLVIPAIWWQDPSLGGHAVVPAFLLLALAVPVGGRVEPDERELAASLRAAAWAGVALLLLCLLVSTLHLFASWGSVRPLGAFLHLLPVGAAVAMVGVHALAGLCLVREPRPGWHGRVLALGGLALLVAPFWSVVAMALDVGSVDQAAVSTAEQAEWRIEDDSIVVTSRIRMWRWPSVDEALGLDLYLPVEAGEMRSARIGGARSDWEALPLRATGHGGYRVTIPHQTLATASEGGGPLVREATLEVDWRMPLATWRGDGDRLCIRLRSLLPVQRYVSYLELTPDDAWRFADGATGRRQLFRWTGPGGAGGLHFGTMTLPIEPLGSDRVPPEAP